MKKIIVLLTLMFFTIIMSGCILQEGSLTTSSGSERYDLEYENITVEETHEFELTENDYLSISVLKNKGRIKVLVKDSGGNEIYSGSNLPTSGFNVEVKKADTYTIEINGRRVSGELHFNKVRKN